MCLQLRTRGRAGCAPSFSRSAPPAAAPAAPAGPEIVNWTIKAEKANIMVMVANRSIIEHACPLENEGKPRSLLAALRGGWQGCRARRCRGQHVPRATVLLAVAAGQGSATCLTQPPSPCPTGRAVCDFRQIWRHAVPGTLCFFKECSFTYDRKFQQRPDNLWGWDEVLLIAAGIFYPNREEFVPTGTVKQTVRAEVIGAPRPAGRELRGAKQPGAPRSPPRSHLACLLRCCGALLRRLHRWQLAVHA